MEQVRDVGSLLFTRRSTLVQQNADTSLSCHHNKTNSETESKLDAWLILENSNVIDNQDRQSRLG